MSQAMFEIFTETYLIHDVGSCSPQSGVAEPGGGGGQGGHGPPKNWSGWAKVCFAPPPKILTTGPPKWAASGQTLWQIASEHPGMCKIFKIFACGGLTWVELIPQVISCFFGASFFTF